MGEDCSYPYCHGKLKEVASYVQLQELVFISAQLKWLDYIQHACKRLSCSQKNDSDNMIKAPVPKTPLAYSVDSASIIAHTIYQKFKLQVANYRQEEDWAKINFPMRKAYKIGRSYRVICRGIRLWNKNVNKKNFPMKNKMGRLRIIYTFAPVLVFLERLITCHFP